MRRAAAGGTDWHPMPILAMLSVLMLGGCSTTPGSSPLDTPTAVAPSPTASPAPTAPPTPPVGSGSITVSSILGTTPAAPPPDTTWVRVSDPGASISFEVPSAWAHAALYPWVEDDASVGVLLAAGPDPSLLGSDFGVSGVAIGISANPGGLTPRAMVEADDYSSVCTATPAQDAAEPGVVAAYRSWEGCGPDGQGFVLIMGIAAEAGGGLIGVVLQGTSSTDLAYLPHILESLRAEGESPPSPATTPGAGDTPGPAETPPSGATYTITMDLCQNQHGQGVAEGLIRNDDALPHAFVVEVWFYDVSGPLLNTTRSYETPALPPGESFRWQAVVPSGLPGVEVTCRLQDVFVR